MKADDIAPIREYLEAVYPAAAPRLGHLPSKELYQLFESLDYYYNFSPEARAAVQPPVWTADNVPPLPYLPRGAYYHARGHAPLEKGRLNTILWGSFERHSEPVSVIDDKMHKDQAAQFRSSFGARMGPQPSWTSPFAIVRYVHFPNGLRTRASAAHPPKARLVSTDGFFDVMNKNVSSAVGMDTMTRSTFSREPHRDLSSQLHQLRDGDFVEVEQWGGLLGSEECPPVCGLWANIWRGTGVMLRVSQPFVSFSKSTAIIEMAERVAARNFSAFEELLALLGAEAPVRALHAQHPSVPLWECLSSYMLSILPCAGARAARGEAYGKLGRRWAEMARRSRPDAILRWALELRTASRGSPFSDAERFALYWIMSVCGQGHSTVVSPFWHASPVGPDSLLATLACILGHRTIVLTASANDNGLLHQELVDFELPPPMGWPIVRADATNNVKRCISNDAFAFLAEDRRGGAQAKASRRSQMLDFWRSTGKFALPVDPTEGPRQRQGAPCMLAFGRSDGGAGLNSACVGPKQRTPPTAAKACWAHCNGTMSQAVLFTASLGHVFTSGSVNPRRRVANRHLGESGENASSFNSRAGRRSSAYRP